MADVEDPITATSVCTIDEAYEFSAPKFYNFMVGETEAEVREAEMWFESKCSYAPSRMSTSFAPFVFVFSILFSGSLISFSIHALLMGILDFSDTDFFSVFSGTHFLYGLDAVSFNCDDFVI